MYNVRRFHRQFESIEIKKNVLCTFHKYKILKCENCKNLELMKLNFSISQLSTQNILQNINLMSTVIMSNA